MQWWRLEDVVESKCRIFVILIRIDFVLGGE